MHSGQIFMIIMTALITAGVTLSMFAMAWAEGRKRNGDAAGPERLEAITARLTRMEEAIESVALEMERVAEGQRFTARLLAERVSSAPAPVSRPVSQNDPKHVTPH